MKAEGKDFWLGNALGEGGTSLIRSDARKKCYTSRLDLLVRRPKVLDT
jgi:hypothetical protein